MNNYKNNYNHYIDEILKNVIVIYTDNTVERFDAIRITEKGIKYGRMITGEFTFFGFIPDHSIKEIYDGFKGKIKNRDIWNLKS